MDIREVGSRGGKATMSKLSKKERSELGRKGARARWDKAKKDQVDVK